MATAKRNPAARVLRALSWLVTEANTDYGVREMATALQIPASAAHRLLSVLLKEDYVRQKASSSRYLLGPQLLRLANVAVAKSPLGQIAHDRMAELVDDTGESALLGHFDDSRLEMMFAKIIESSAPLRYVVQLNTWMPLYAGASGLAIMAYLSEEQVGQIIRRTLLAPLTDRTITDPARLKASLRQIRTRGYALTRGQRVPGAVGIAAPIFGDDANVLGDICLAVPEQRFVSTGHRLPELVRKCAAAITRNIGGAARGFAATQTRRHRTRTDS